jgi:hypothetical protein
MLVVVVAVVATRAAVLAAAAMMVGPRTSTRHRQIMNETATEIEGRAEFTTRTGMRTERQIREPLAAALARTRSPMISRTPKRVESAHRGVLRLVQSAGVGS